MEWLFGLSLFWFGAIFGSFAGAVAWRLYKKRDFVHERSECEHCHHILAPIDLIPIGSWLWLRGKCRYCHKSIGIHMIITEVLLGLAYAVSYIYWPYGLESLLSGGLFGLWLVALVLLAILFVYDLRWSLLPDKAMFPLIVIACIIFFCRMMLCGTSWTVWPIEALYGLLPVAGVYGLLHILSKGEWVGLGDVKLGIAIGFLVGWQGALLTLILANFLGFLYVLPGLVTQKLSRTAHIPFGPFLIAATVVAFLFGEELVQLYVGFVLGV